VLARRPQRPGLTGVLALKGLAMAWFQLDCPMAAIDGFTQEPALIIHDGELHRSSKQGRTQKTHIRSVWRTRRRRDLRPHERRPHPWYLKHKPPPPIPAVATTSLRFRCSKTARFPPRRF